MSESTASGSWSRTWEGLASPGLTQALAQIASLRRLSDREALYHRGEPGHYLVGIRSGALRLSAAGADGSEVTVGIYGAGTWFGEVSVFDQRPRPSDAHALGPTEVMLVPGVRLLEVLDANPLWYRDFARVLCNKLRLAMAHIESAILPPPVRVALRLLDLAQGMGEPGGEGMMLKLSQEELGRMLGLTRQSINKALRLLEDRGWLLIRRSELVLLDSAALRAYVIEGGGGDLLPA